MRCADGWFVRVCTIRQITHYKIHHLDQWRFRLALNSDRSNDWRFLCTQLELLFLAMTPAWRTLWRRRWWWGCTSCRGPSLDGAQKDLHVCTCLALSAVEVKSEVQEVVDGLNVPVDTLYKFGDGQQWHSCQAINSIGKFALLSCRFCRVQWGGVRGHPVELHEQVYVEGKSLLEKVKIVF